MAQPYIRWEVWVSDQFIAPIPAKAWRFNACFDKRSDAETEEKWYIKHGYATDVRVRTTRFQRHEHISQLVMTLRIWTMLKNMMIKVYSFAQMTIGLQLIAQDQWKELWVARELAKIRRRIGYTVVLIY